MYRGAPDIVSTYGVLDELLRAPFDRRMPWIFAGIGGLRTQDALQEQGLSIRGDSQRNVVRKTKIALVVTI